MYYNIKNTFISRNCGPHNPFAGMLIVYKLYTNVYNIYYLICLISDKTIKGQTIYSDP